MFSCCNSKILIISFLVSLSGLFPFTGSESLNSLPVKSSLVNFSLVIPEGNGKALGENQRRNEKQRQQQDLWSMVASMEGSNGITADSTFAEYNNNVQQRANDGEQSSEELLKLDWHVKLDQANRFGLDWSFDYRGNQIMFALNINDNGSTSNFRRGIDIFALGFSQYGELKSSDFCIVWYDLGHRIHLQDARTDQFGKLELIDESMSVCKLVNPHRGGGGWKKRLASPVMRPVDEASEAQLDGFDSSSEWRHAGAARTKERRWLAEDGPEAEEPDGDKAKEDLDDSSSSSSPSTFRIIFRRPLEVCGNDLRRAREGDQQYYTIDNGTTHLVWFILKGPLLSIDGLNITELACSAAASNVSNGSMPMGSGKHGGHRQQQTDTRFSFGLRRVQLLASHSRNSKGSSQAVIPTKGSNFLDVKMRNFEIPAKETTYWCKLFKLPHKFESRRFHITKYEAVIERGNEHIVHHMELFNCANLDSEQELELNRLYNNNNGTGWAGECSGRDRPKATQPCRRVILAWAMGAHPLEYPEQVGQSIGGQKYSPFVVLEVHYNNIGSTPSLIDNSGLRFYYTSKLRPYDSGILEVGLEYVDKYSIPPNMITPIAGHCVSECTRAALGGASRLGAASSIGTATYTNNNKPPLEDGIYVFAAQLHTHLSGIASWTELVREGKLIGELQRDNHFSPHFQEIRLLPEPVHIAPGDSLIHYCLYDTRDRVNITLGGEATTDEMCVTYLHYYPRVDLEVCKSSVQTEALEAYFAYLNKEEAQKTSLELLELNPLDGEAKSVSENYKSIQWSNRRREELIQFYSRAPLSIQCNRSNGERFPGFWNGVTPTRLLNSQDNNNGARRLAPFDSRLPVGKELVEYRGQFSAGRPDPNGRHAHCGLSQ